MTPQNFKQSDQKIINKPKWKDILSQFIDVLRINIFIIDKDGSVLLPPNVERYGGRLLTDPSFNFDWVSDPRGYLKKFEQNGQFLEFNDRFKMSAFAIPFHMVSDQTKTYMIVGPVILNKRLEKSVYIQLARKAGINENDFLNEINGLRVISNVTIISILDLLSEISKKDKDINKEQKAPFKKGGKENQSIQSSVRLDEFLITLLDMALKLTHTEYGSIMLIDDEQGDLTIKVSRGLEAKKTKNLRVKLGEGIAGKAVKDNSLFIIQGQKGDRNISHLLKRPEIKKAFIMPLAVRNRVVGVMNLHTKKEENRVSDNLESLRHLSNLVASVF